MNEEPARFGSVWQRRRNPKLLAAIAIQLQLLDEEHLRNLLFCGYLHINLLAVDSGEFGLDDVSIVFSDSAAISEDLTPVFGFEYAVEDYAPIDHPATVLAPADSPFVNEFVNLPRLELLNFYIEFVIDMDPLSVVMTDLARLDRDLDQILNKCIAGAHRIRKRS